MGDQIRKIAVDRDASAFRSLFLTYYPKVKAMLVRQGADNDAAEEIAQDTLFTVWQKSDQFSYDRGSVSAWLYTIARNLRIDRIRKQAVWQRCYQELEAMENLRGSAYTIQSEAQERRKIGAVLNKLPRDQRQVIELSFIDGLSQSEIARKLDVPLGTVKSRMRLAFEKLRVDVGHSS